MSNRSNQALNLNKFKEQLIRQRDELMALEESSKTASEAVELDQTRQGRLSRMDALQQQAMAQESGRRRRLELIRIDAALKRIENNEYGECLTCGEEIAEGRLRFDPSVTQCIHCAERQDS